MGLMRLNKYGFVGISHVETNGVGTGYIEMSPLQVPVPVLNIKGNNIFSLNCILVCIVLNVRVCIIQCFLNHVALLTGKKFEILAKIPLNLKAVR
jgi:hypothetical protein